MVRGRQRTVAARNVWRAWACAALLIGCAIAAAAGQRLPQAPGAALELRVATRIDAAGEGRPVVLPDYVAATEGRAGVQARYRLQADLGAPPPGGLALYFPGLRAHAAVRVNGHALQQLPDEPLGPNPRSLRAVRLIPLPAHSLRAGVNDIEIDLRGPAALSLSPVWIGDERALAGRLERRVLGLAIGPLIVAAFMVSLGLSVLVLYVRRRDETMYAYFAFGALVWGLQTAWSALPTPLLTGAHRTVWLTSMYVFFVVMMALFGLRFAGVHWLRLERLLKRAALAWPAVMYGAAALGGLAPFEKYSRLALVFIAFGALGVVATRAWRRRDMGSVLLVVAGVVGAGFGLRDWLLDASGIDNNPVFLTPYAGLPFVILVSWFLIDRFVRATNALEGLNRELEVRVERKSAELVTALDEMRAARDNAESANQAKGRFLAAASHDLRQPIHALGLYMGTLRQRPLEAPMREIVDRMHSSVAALESLLEALLDISRMDAGALVPQPRAFDLAALVHRLADEFAPEAEGRGLRLSARIGGTPPAAAWSDPILVERVLRNLIGNAVKYTRAGGVLVTCRPRSRSGSGNWRVEVWDTGPGIAADEQEHVFDEFYQAGNAERDRLGGLGLGLAIVRRLARLLQLPLALHSRRGRGTRFVLDLPATRLPIALGFASDPELPLLQGLAVAVIEDDVEVRAAMRTLLADWGCRVFAGADADEVLRQVCDTVFTPAAVVADLRLRAERNGLGEIARLRAVWGEGLPALIVSGDTAPERVRLMQVSGLPWLAKPVAAARLRSWLLAVVQRPTAPSATDAAQPRQESA